MTSGAPPPNTASLAEAREWLDRADTDLLAAGKLLRTRPRLLAIAVYHAQQAAEKALKAFLAAYNTPFRKTHDLEEVLRACCRRTRRGTARGSDTPMGRSRVGPAPANG